jgi:transposase
VAATSGEAMPRIEIVSDRRRAHTAEFRARVVAESFAAGARVREVAERHGICASLIYRWRRLAGTDAVGEGELRLLPVRVSDACEATASLVPSRSPRADAAPRAGSIEIELAGDVRVRVDASVSLVALRRVMTVLRK